MARYKIELDHTALNQKNMKIKLYQKNISDYTQRLKKETMASCGLKALDLNIACPACLLQTLDGGLSSDFLSARSSCTFYA